MGMPSHKAKQALLAVENAVRAKIEITIRDRLELGT
jgi:hypothetical protein